MRQILVCSIVIGVTLVMSAPAYAYLDPGTGSVLVQGLLAGVASALAVLKIYWQRLVKFFANLKQRFCNRSLEKTEKIPTDKPETSDKPPSSPQ